MSNHNICSSASVATKKKNPSQPFNVPLAKYFKIKQDKKELQNHCKRQQNELRAQFCKHIYFLLTQITPLISTRLLAETNWFPCAQKLAGVGYYKTAELWDLKT